MVDARPIALEVLEEPNLAQLILAELLTAEHYKPADWRSAEEHILTEDMIRA